MSPRRRFPSTHRAPRQRPASPLRRRARKARNRPARVHLLAPPPGRRRLRPPRRHPAPAAYLHRASTPPYFSRAATYQAPRRPRLAASSPDPGLPSSDPPLPIPAASRAAAGEAPPSLAGFTIGRRRPCLPDPIGIEGDEPLLVGLRTSPARPRPREGPAPRGPASRASRPRSPAPEWATSSEPGQIHLPPGPARPPASPPLRTGPRPRVSSPLQIPLLCTAGPAYFGPICFFYRSVILAFIQ